MTSKHHLINGDLLQVKVSAVHNIHRSPSIIISAESTIFSKGLSKVSLSLSVTLWKIDSNLTNIHKKKDASYHSDYFLSLSLMKMPCYLSTSNIFLFNQSKVSCNSYLINVKVWSQAKQFNKWQHPWLCLTDNKSQISYSPLLVICTLTKK